MINNKSTKVKFFFRYVGTNIVFEIQAFDEMARVVYDSVIMEKDPANILAWAISCLDFCASTWTLDKTRIWYLTDMQNKINEYARKLD
jgi:hypothetical protein